MSHKVQAHQTVRVLTLQIAVPAELVENGIAEHELSEKLSALGTDHAESAILALQAGLACEQDPPLLAGDMQRVLDNLRALQGGAVHAPAMPAGAAAPLYLSNYGKPGA